MLTGNIYLCIKCKEGEQQEKHPKKNKEYTKSSMKGKKSQALNGPRTQNS